ncbi:hypothetical protein ACLBYF_22200 [Methylobacterium brachiatum]
MADHPHGLKISDAAAIFRSPGIDSFAAILSLACSGSLALDLRSTLSPDSLVRIPSVRPTGRGGQSFLDSNASQA